MSKSLSRKNFMINLCKRGIPARYAWRVSKELNDHETDLMENQSESSLGNPDELLDQIERTYRQRSFAGRHPILIFLTLPLPIVFLAYFTSLIIPYIGLVIFYSLTKFAGLQFEETSQAIGITFGISLIIFPTILSTILIFRWARKSGLRMIQSCASCIPVFCMALLFTTNFFVSDIENKVGFSFGLNVPAGRWLGPAFGSPEQAWPLPGFNQLMQLTISVLVIFYMIYHEKTKVNRLAEKLVSTEDP